MAERDKQQQIMELKAEYNLIDRQKLRPATVDFELQEKKQQRETAFHHRSSASIEVDKAFEMMVLYQRKLDALRENAEINDTKDNRKLITQIEAELRVHEADTSSALAGWEYYDRRLDAAQQEVTRLSQQIKNIRSLDIKALQKRQQQIRQELKALGVEEILQVNPQKDREQTLLQQRFQARGHFRDRAVEDRDVLDFDR